MSNIHTYLSRQALQRAIAYISDVRNIGTVAFGIIAVLVTWSGVKVVQTNYDLQKQISAMEQQNEVQQLANSNLKLKNQYLKTDEYLELAARRHFNKAAPGEKLLVVPRSVALSHTVKLPEPPEAKSLAKAMPARQEAVQAGSWYERNLNAWLEFLFHRRD